MGGDTTAGHAPASGRPARSSWRRNLPSGETVWALVLLVSAVALLLWSLRIDVRRAHDPLGARFFPLVEGGLLAVSTLVLLLRRAVAALRRSVATYRKTAAAREAAPASAGDRRVLMMVAITGGYVALLPVLTYIPATALAMAGVMYVLGARRRLLVLAPVVTSVAVYAVFTYLLHVNLP